MSSRCFWQLEAGRHFPLDQSELLALSLLRNQKALWKDTISKLMLCSFSHHEETSLFLISTSPAIAGPWTPPLTPVVFRALRVYKTCPQTNQLYSHSVDSQQACCSQALPFPAEFVGVDDLSTEYYRSCLEIWCEVDGELLFSLSSCVQ